MAEFSNKITLLSCDGGSLEVDKEAALVSKLIDQTLEGTDDDEEASLPLPDVTAATLEKIIEFMNMYKINPVSEIKKPLAPDSDLSKILENTPEYIKYLQEFDNGTPEELEKLYELILAADYMDIRPLLDLACAKITFLSKIPPDNKSVIELFTTSATAAMSDCQIWDVQPEMIRSIDHGQAPWVMTVDQEVEHTKPKVLEMIEALEMIEVLEQVEIELTLFSHFFPPSAYFFWITITLAFFGASDRVFSITITCFWNKIKLGYSITVTFEINKTRLRILSR